MKLAVPVMLPTGAIPFLVYFDPLARNYKDDLCQLVAYSF